MMTNLLKPSEQQLDNILSFDDGFLLEPNDLSLNNISNNGMLNPKSNYWTIF